MSKNTDELILIGDLMSNVFFNWRQQDRFLADDRQLMKSLQERWDEARYKMKAASALGSVKSERKAKTSAENGKKGGRPRIQK